MAAPASGSPPRLPVHRRPAGLRHVLDHGWRRPLSRARGLARVALARLPDGTPALGRVRVLRPDLPLFVFIVGIVLPMSLRRYESQPSAATHGSCADSRCCCCSAGSTGPAPVRLPEMRWPGVLQRIAICYLFTALAVLHLGVRGQAILAAVAVARLLGPARLRPGAGFPAPTTSRPKATWSAISIDSCCRKVLLLSLWRQRRPAVAHPGGGDVPARRAHRLVARAAQTGDEEAARDSLRQAWRPGARPGVVAAVPDHQEPVDQLVRPDRRGLEPAAGGALFYFVIDIQGARRWAFPFVVIGMNAITIYVAQEFINFPDISKSSWAGWPCWPAGPGW